MLSFAFYFLCMKWENNDVENGRHMEYPPQYGHGENLICSNPYSKFSEVHSIQHKLRSIYLTQKLCIHYCKKQIHILIITSLTTNTATLIRDLYTHILDLLVNNKWKMD